MDMMMKLRGTDTIENLTSGPGKLCQALQINREFDGKDMTSPESGLFLCYGEKQISSHDIISTTRVGISKAADLPLRFYVKNSPYVSVKG